jgi:hypothetical protein
VKREGGIKASHFYLLLAMVAATAAVVLSPHTHPAALVLLSAGDSRRRSGRQRVASGADGLFQRQSTTCASHVSRSHRA